MTRFVFSVLLSTLVAGSSLAQTAAQQEAGDVSEVDKDRLGPLRERVQPVSGHVFRKKGRIEFSPAGSLSFKDAFFTKYSVGAALTYHPAEDFGISGHFNYVFAGVSGAAEICTFTATVPSCRAPAKSELDGRAPGQIKMMASLDGQWAPIYGKFSLISESFMHFDLYGVGGPTMVQYLAPAASGNGSATETTIGGNVGLGLRIFLNRWATLRAELRDVIYSEKVMQPQPANNLRQQFFFELGFSMFFPNNVSTP
jgi:outer membrane beta-barrel protein